MELHLVQPDDVGVLEQLQRGDLPLYLHRPSQHQNNRPLMSKRKSIAIDQNQMDTHAPARRSSWRGCAGGRGS